MNTIKNLPWPSILAAIVSLSTALQILALIAGKFWAPALKVASVLGAFALDVQKVAGWVGGAPVYTSIQAKQVGKKIVDDPKAALDAGKVAS